MKNVLLIIFCSLLITLPSCSKKADGDEEMRKMIVGTWGREINHCTFCGKDTEIFEFSEDGRYREIRYEGRVGDWGKVDTTGIAGAVHVGYHISFEDSVYYEINDGDIYLQGVHSIINGRTVGVEWIKPNKLNIEGLNKNEKYEKI